MEALLTFTFKDFIAFMIPLFIGGLIFNRRRKRKEVRVKFSFLWLVLIVQQIQRRGFVGLGGKSASDLM